MSWVKKALEQLNRDGQCIIHPIGNSMRGKIESGQKVILSNQKLDELMAGDVVFIRWKGNYLLHLIMELHGESVLIGNNLGKVNGRIPKSDILAKVIRIDV